MNFKILMILTKLSLYLSLFYSLDQLLFVFLDFYSALTSNITTIIGLILFPSFLSNIFMLIWMYIVSRNAHRYTESELSYGTFGIVGWWFVPILNLVKPYRVMEEVWEVSFESDDEKKKMDNWFTWYVFYSLFLLVTVLVDRYANISYEDTKAMYGLLEVFRLIWIVLTIRFVEALSQQQILKWKIST